MSLFKYDGSIAVESAAPSNNFYGTDGAETLIGTGAAEALWGKGADLLIGGAGDDVYYLQQGDSRIDERPGGGVDTIVAWKNTSLANFADVENLRIDSDGIYAAGNALDNVLFAGSGAEQLYGGFGRDVLVAGSGKDTFVVVKGEGSDAIYGFKTATDVVRLSAGFTSFADLRAHMSQVGADARIEFGNGEGLVLRGVQAGALTAANFQLQLDASKLGAVSFHDEFSGPLSVWNPIYNPGGTWRPDYGYQGPDGAGSYTLASNGEQQIYTSPYFRNHPGDFAESPFVSNPDGTLSIIARPSANSELFGFGYTSGMISTKQSFAQTYGYFEMRAELPHAAGAWPAFWLVPADGSWPPELDVMETLSNDPHSDWTTAHSQASGSHTSQGVASYIPDTADGFHTYGVLWTKTDLVWYVDGTEVFHAATPADMNKPMYMIANLALGGWGGWVDNSALPAEMTIDYIRAYQLGALTGSETPLYGAPSPPPPPASPPPVSPPPAIPSPPPVTGGGGQASGDAPVLLGSAGSDNLHASSGLTEVHAGAGDDTITGWGGAGFLTGDDGADVIQGGSGFDRTNGNAGNDTVHGNGGDDWVTGGKDQDVLFGDDGADILNGNLGNDTGDGGAGNDTVRGGQGDDVLAGGAGDDLMTGDLGADTLSGGTGADTFRGFAGGGIDVITDFNPAEGDRIALDPGTTHFELQAGADVIVNLGGGAELILKNVQLAALPTGWIFSD